MGGPVPADAWGLRRAAPRGGGGGQCAASRPRGPGWRQGSRPAPHGSKAGIDMKIGRWIVAAGWAAATATATGRGRQRALRPRRHGRG
ncbi:MAG: hypothetical protein MZW92_23820 [Comamonadaceae bacterium]|nr:hypothetical protein [Comamonadaceae bacterium]